MASKELELDDIKKVCGGTTNVKDLYYLNLFFQTVAAKYNAWSESGISYSQEVKVQMAKQFFQEAYDALDDHGKQIIDEFKRDYPYYWDQFIKSLAGHN